MEKTLLIFCIVLFSSSFVSSQDVSIKVYNPPIPYTGSVEWGNDLIVSSSEPEGRPSGIFRTSNSTIYVSVPDTNIVAGSGIVLLISTNNGSNWSIASSIQPQFIYPKTKMILSSLDSVYCFFQQGNAIFVWNVINSRVAQIRSTGYRDFDVAASSTSLYIVIDSLGSNQLIRYGSSDGGVTWGQRGNITTAGAFPKIYFSPFGDTLTLNYYGPVLADTATSVIRNARYRESAPATMAVVGAFTNVAISNLPKTEFSTVRYGNTVWFFYTSEEAGNVDIKCKVSTNAGVSFTDSTIIGAISGNDEYWFDAKHHTRGPGGADIIYNSGPLVATSGVGGPATLHYSSSNFDDPLNFEFGAIISNHPPVTSTIGYIPTLIEFYDFTDDAGALWVGDDSGIKRLYFDRMNIPSTLSLTINYEVCASIDSIDIELRNVSSPYEIIESRKRLGGLGTTLQLTFTNPIQGVNYYIVIRHRNSIETWSKFGGEIFNSFFLSYDFTSASSQAFGNNMVLVGSDYSFYTGDVNQDGSVDVTDIVAIYNDASAFVSGYVPTDLNCDSFVDVTDLIAAYNNSVQFISVIRP